MPIIGSRGAASASGFGQRSGVGILIDASGGSIEEIGDYRVHTFTSNGNFVVNEIAGSVPSPAQAVDYIVVAGGGGGGYSYGAGAGAGGYRESHVEAISGPYTASPLASTTSIPISASPGTYPIVVGAGGGQSGLYNDGQNGSPSSFSTISASGGGGGGGTGQGPGNPGGSGGGGGKQSGAPSGSGNSGGYSPPEGNPGGPGSPSTGGGGGADSAGTGGNSSGTGGAGTFSAMSAVAGIHGPNASYRYFAGGGAPSQSPAPTGAGGIGGGAKNPYNTINSPSPTYNFNKGQPGTGGGGGGDFINEPQVGGPGTVVIRYKYK
tara:strand:- start:1841 stop:2803 length:963 start_codon:yes stop_codon:yes gene_type:complete